MKWFRFYSEVLHDSKVQMLPPELFRAWVNLLCVASESSHRGLLPDVRQLAFSLRLSEAKTGEVLSQLTSARLLDEDADGGLRPHNWAKRQPDSTSSSERVKRYRERVRKNGETVTGYTKHRSKILSRDGNACVYCLATKRLVLDHLIPVSRGGTGDVDNLVAACKACNAGKAGRLVEESGYAFMNPAAAALYEVAKSRFGIGHVTVNDDDCHDDVTPPVTVTGVTDSEAVTPRARKRRLEEKRLEEQPPLPPSGGTAAARFAPLPPGAEEAIAEARSRVSDDAAEIVRREASAIDRQLGGRFDLFVEALEAAQNRRPKLEVRHVFSWAMKRALGRLSDPPPARHVNGAVLSPADRATPIADPAKAASKSCEHCSGEGVVTVYHPAPDPARRIPATTPADCVCAWGRIVRSKRSAEDAARIPDLADVLARRCAWLADRP